MLDTAVFSPSKHWTPRPLAISQRRTVWSFSPPPDSMWAPSDKGDALDAPVVFGEAADLTPGLDVPNAYGAVLAAGGSKTAIRCDGNARNHDRSRTELANARLVSRSQSVAVPSTVADNARRPSGIKITLRNFGCVQLGLADLSAVLQIPDSNRPVRRT